MSRTVSATDAEDLPPATANLQHSRKQLLDWYLEHSRDLPWRETHDAYRIWVSEIMLQQTQVATVIDYYHRFLQEFPSVDCLAQASEPEVLKLWSGLGYYRRARQLHEAAKRIVADFEGNFPRRFEEILSLPGIGRYTAGAIASFAYDQPKPILEANTIRLFSRLIGLREDPRSKRSQNALWGMAEQWVQPEIATDTETTAPRSPRPRKTQADLNSAFSPGKTNQALMELGSLICRPNSPDCPACPLNDVCRAHQLGLQHEIPLKTDKPKFIPVDHVLAIVKYRGKTLFRQNQPGQWWEGLWDFPRLEVNSTSAKSSLKATAKSASRRLLEQEFQAAFELDLELGSKVRTIKHGVTKYRISLHCFEATSREPIRLKSLPGNWKWQDTSNAPDAIPLTSTATKLSAWLNFS